MLREWGEKIRDMKNDLGGKKRWEGGVLETGGRGGMCQMCPIYPSPKIREPSPIPSHRSGTVPRKKKEHEEKNLKRK